MKKVYLAVVGLLALSACASVQGDRTRVERYGDVCYYVEEVDANNDFDRDSVSPALACPDLVKP